MFNLIKSVNYVLKRDKGVLLSYLFIFIIPILLLLMFGLFQLPSLKDLTPGFYYGMDMLSGFAAFSFIGIVIISSKAIAGDESDKTINYDILSGHRRIAVFSSRVLAGLVWGAFFVLVIQMIPVFGMALINGWGAQVNAKDLIIRICLTIFPFIRLSAMTMMLASLTKKAGLGIVLGLSTDILTSIIQALAEEIFHYEIRYEVAFMNMVALLTPENSREYIIDGKPVQVFDTAVSPEMVIKTIGFSLGFTVLYLLIAYIVFKKRDRS
ncbi:MAG: ABC transporter permease [Lachnospiraceae bacterium]|nr:ABC transporter permease [Lachnospiraceae bacterium]